MFEVRQLRAGSELVMYGAGLIKGTSSATITSLLEICGALHSTKVTSAPEVAVRVSLSIIENEDERNWNVAGNMFARWSYCANQSQSSSIV